MHTHHMILLAKLSQNTFNMHSSSCHTPKEILHLQAFHNTMPSAATFGHKHCLPGTRNNSPQTNNACHGLLVGIPRCYLCSPCDLGREMVLVRGLVGSPVLPCRLREGEEVERVAARTRMLPRDGSASPMDVWADRLLRKAKVQNECVFPHVPIFKLNKLAIVLTLRRRLNGGQSQ